MEALRQLFLTLGLDADEASFASATAAVDLLEKGLDLAVKAAEALGKALVDTVVGAVDYADKIGDAATKTGVSTTSLQELEYAAVQSGTSMEGVVGALVFLNRNLYEAATSGGEAAESFAKLGIKVKDAGGKIRDPSAVFLDLAEAIEKVPPGAARSALAMKVLGRSGAELVPMLASGKEGLEALRAEAWAMGAVLGPEQLAQAKVFADTWAGMTRTFDAVRNELGLMLVQELIPIVDAFKAWWLQNNTLVKSKLKAFIDGVRAAIRGLNAIVTKVVDNFELLVAVVKLAAIAVGSYFVASALVAAGSLTALLVNLALNTAAAVAYGATMVAAGLASAAAWVAAEWPILAIAAALALVALVAEDIWVFLEGGDSLIGELGPKWTAFLDEWTKPLPTDSEFMQGLKLLIGGLSDIEGKAIPALKDAWQSVVEYFKYSLLGFVEDAKIAFYKLRDYVKSIPGIGFIIEQAQRLAPITTMTAGEIIGGGAVSPAAAAANKRNEKVWAPTLNNSVVVNAAPGQSPQDVARTVREALEDDDWWDSKLRPVGYATE